MSVTVELRDTSANALAEIRALVWRYGGNVAAIHGPIVTVEALTPKAEAALFSALEADPRVISNAQRDAAERTARYVEHQQAVEVDRVARLEAVVAAQAQQINDLKSVTDRQRLELEARDAELERR
jgi:hypothetical protein